MNPLRRPSALLALGFLALLPLVPASGAAIPPEVQALHDDVWRRFVNESGLVLDYAAELPTPEECEAGKPNAVSWWTPVENGAFFTGLYLDAMVRRWELTGADADRENARRLAEGLLRCASVGQTPGFVARFVLPDGKSHYALGSDDQTGPWFYGLWRYARSGIPGAEEKARVVAKMAEVAEALRKVRWLLPCDPVGEIGAGQHRGTFGGADYRSASRLLFVLRVMGELTGDAHWKQDYRRALDETPSGAAKSRLQIVAEGMPGEFALHPALAKSQLWIYVNSQAMLRELDALEDDPAVQARYREAMETNAREVAPRLAPRPARPGPFNADWRALCALWAPQKTSEEATKVAETQFPLWKNEGRAYEIAALREPLCAAWIVLLAPAAPDGAGRQAAETLRSLLRGTPWPEVASSFGFFGEAAWYQLQAAPEAALAEAEPR